MREHFIGNISYGIRPDGTIEYGETLSVEINGKTLYRFNPQTGVLQVSMSPGHLEILVEQLGGLPMEGRDIKLPTPAFANGPTIFRNVRKVEPIPGLKLGEYMMSIGEGGDRSEN
ncbi:MAG: hypothetical protein AABX33_07465 [Nanoarchaeota archaeon]